MKKASSQVIVRMTLDSEELRRFVENLPKLDATIIRTGNLAFRLLNDLTILEAQLPEYHFMENFLYDAIFVPPGTQSPSREVLLEPKTSAYIKDFGTLKDEICYVAKINGDVIGMVWIRVYDSYGYMDDQTPELAISVLPKYRNMGNGTKLLSSSFNHLQTKGYKQISLSVLKTNPALHFFQNIGCEIVKENEKNYTMIKQLIL